MRNPIAIINELRRCRLASPDAYAERIKALEWALGEDEEEKLARDQRRLDKSVEAGARKTQRAEQRLALEQRNAEILRLKRSGVTYREIAARTGVAKSYVYYLTLKAERREQWRAEEERAGRA